MKESDPYEEGLSDRLEDAMKEAGIIKAQLASHCELSPPAITRWCNGTAQAIRPVHLFAAADLLGVNARWLATGEGPRHPESASTLCDVRVTTDKLLEELFRRMAVAPSHTRQTILDLLRLDWEKTGFTQGEVARTVALLIEQANQDVADP